MSESVPVDELRPEPKWQPLSATQRRVVGVLIEKAKTTPDAYPLSLNGLTTGCNQKSNRAPQMNVEADDVEEALDQLRSMGAIGEVHGGGRVVKYRHYMKEWLGVSGAELAVMAELLLRGPQTIGELRARAARMASGAIPDLAALRPLLTSLIDQRLVVPLTPEGRGQVITHALYPPQEMERMRARHGSTGGYEPAATEPIERSAVSEASARTAAADEDSPVTDVSATTPLVCRSDFDQLRNEVSQLRADVERLRKEVEDVWANLR